MKVGSSVFLCHGEIPEKVGILRQRIHWGKSMLRASDITLNTIVIVLVEVDVFISGQEVDAVVV